MEQQAHRDLHRYFPPSKYLPVVGASSESIPFVSVNGRRVTTYTLYSQDGFIAFIGKPVSKRDVLNCTSSPAEYKKEYNKRMFNALGMSPSALYQWTRKLHYKIVVVPVQQHFCLFRDRVISEMALRSVWKNKDILDQALADGQRNITPILLLLGKNPSECKDFLGKSLWKKLCANSLSRNLLIYRALVNMSAFTHKLNEGRKSMLSDANSLPSTLLSYTYANFSNMFYANFYIIAKQMKGQWSNKKAVREANHLIKDTRRMFLQVRGSIPGNFQEWSMRRIKEEHDTLSKEVAKAANARYSPEVFECLKYGPHKFPFVFEHNKLKAILLQSAQDIVEEGRVQKHCVGSYANSVRIGGSLGRGTLIYSIRNEEGERKSTVMFEFTDKWSVEQHYASCNSDPSEECEEVVRELLREMRL